MPAGNGGDETPAGSQVVFSLQLLHAADMDGATGALDNVENFSALVSHFQNAMPAKTLVLSSGDNYIPGPRYFAAEDDALSAVLGIPGEGRADIALLNAMGFQASAVGNHELDNGTGTFADLISAETGETSSYAGAGFPYLSSNLNFGQDDNLADLVADNGSVAADIAGRLAASAIITVEGEAIGIVGATTPSLGAITSSGDIGIAPSDADDLDSLTAAIQLAVDRLRITGVNKVILLSHMQQIAIERQLAGKLSGVDIIVAGGSNTLLADANDTLRDGDSAAGSYPEVYTSATGEPVLLVNTDGDYKYLGRLYVGFDVNGAVVLDSLDEAINGAWAAVDDVTAELGAAPVGSVTAIADALRQVLADRDGNILGRTSVYLDGRRSQVRTEETNMGNLTADANLWLAQQADASVQLSIKNGGGIRDDIGLVVQPPGTTDPALVSFLPPPANAAAGKAEGDISQFDVQGVLRFNNGLTLLTVTAAELADIMEHAVSATAPGATPGQFPQIGGFRIEYDSSQSARDGSDTNGDVVVAGERLRKLEILAADGAVTDTVRRRW